MGHTIHHITVSRTARYVVAGEENGAVEVWIVLHGYSQLATNFLRWFEPALRPGRLIVAPEALSRSYFDESKARRVGASWMTREDREAEIEDYVRYLDQLADELLGILPPRPRLELHGFSQGCATAARWATFGRHRIDRLVLWGGTTPPDLDLERLRSNLLGAPIAMVVGDRDQFLTAEHVRAEDERLKGVGLTVDSRTFPGGHMVDPTVLATLA
ncbi:MAG: alpha/beta hydrolase [Gemmatimonadales bacterium]